jgi:integrase
VVPIWYPRFVLGTKLEATLADKIELTKKVVNAAKIRPNRYIVWDSKIPGFGLRIESSGAKYFILKYRSKAGAVRKPTVGRYGSLTVAQAREKAQKWLLEVSQGGDPSGDQKEQRKGLTVREAVRRFDSEHIAQKKPATQYMYRHFIAQEILPSLGSKRIDAVTASDISRLFHRIGKDHPTKANRVRAILSKLFSLSEVWGMRPQNSNPVKFTAKYKEKERHRDLSIEETKSLFAALDWIIESTDAELEKKRAGSETVTAKDELFARGVHNGVAVIKLLVFTGARRGELLTLRWSEVDKEDCVLRLADSKTGEKTISLNNAALSILDSIEKVVGVPWVFPSRHRPKDSPVPPMREDELRHSVWEPVREHAGLGAKVVDGEEIPVFRIHDIRHNFAAVAAAQGKSLIEIGKLLGHRQAKTTERYAKLIEDARRRAAEDIGAAITGMASTPGKKPADVVPIGGATND